MQLVQKKSQKAPILKSTRVRSVNELANCSVEIPFDGLSGIKSKVIDEDFWMRFGIGSAAFLR